MELNDLELFRCVARFGSMSKAAAELGYVQSNVTARIQTLEREFGVALLNRSPKGISLRPEGKQLLAYAEQIHQLVEQAKAEVPSMRARPMRLGASQTLTAAYLNPLIRDPDSGIQVFTRSLEQLAHLLESGELDAILVNREPEQGERLEKVFEADEPIAWMGGGSEHDSVAADLPLLAARDPKCPYRRQTLEQLKRCDPPRRLIEADTLESLVTIVESGHGLALLPIALRTPPMRIFQLPGFDTEKVRIRCYRKTFPSGTFDHPTPGISNEWERLKGLLIR